ncbi:tRNA (adenosine(37)-N6)-threonylcarbamoyltransferase complex ATPase subunit type 1 TsaE [Mariprofundus erugo]|uniref:tRNA threonylcarbamoyladenosine biosynthesis protein TsaE n=1 Tax=Mariprofundus erugo TaxID=2528639 RepID=A0A5R9GUB0_9PROT|nr:tRNA (adenosine(37)-N6)-threonylcarbamoyltransferase complex ATPase subunit type 1 TsaE [Mariprofundus erugo]TLS69118.1 tRNA (adenosine(37)-N6)-threonylcarbamoyltransferase complex ATPase subunit type 1 TsaE [Mariprofundus erugo]TLS74773.1 tRNA (adenosine(37)-N6)-threonylcarbamoyltransferase complex ATPase subunit type 1 TsaE [Mariprofundus erugo]
MQFLAVNEAATVEVACGLAARLKAGDVVALHGDLGAGKSFFSRAVMRALGVRDQALPSPTFAIIQEYDADGCRVAHMDWYRLDDAEEIEMLGVRDYFQPPWICLIEWPGRAPALLPGSVISVHLQCCDDHADARRIDIDG